MAMTTEQKRIANRQAMARWRVNNIEKERARERQKTFNYRRGIGDPAKIAAWLEKMKKKSQARKSQQSQYYFKNKDRIIERQKRNYLRIKSDPILYGKFLERNRISLRGWQKRNPDRVAYHRRKWSKTENGRKAINAYKLMRKRTDPTVALRVTIRSRVSALLRYKGKRFATSGTLLGCSVPDLKAHLQSLFQPGMTWENRGEWEIDHIRPCASFNLLDPEQQRCCFHYTNLQPLWKSDNRKKSAKWQA